MLPAPPNDLVIRDATLADVPFFDAQQRAAKGALGFFPTGQFEGYVREHLALVAEVNGRRVGHLLARDRYSGRDELGIVYQVSCVPDMRRKNVGARLVQEAFSRAAWGVRLYCCWCRQDLEANRFWESLGFVPIAFRTGGRAKKITQVFWQRRVTEGDDATPYWYPYQTRNGAMAEDRLVFPMGTREHWGEARRPALPEDARRPAELQAAEQKRIEASREEKRAARREAKKKTEAAEAERWITIFVGGKLKKIRKPDNAVGWASAHHPGEKTNVLQATDGGLKPTLREKRRTPDKYDRAAVAWCRELRDRWQAVVSAEPGLVESAGRYRIGRDGGRALPERARDHVKLLAA